MGLIFAVAMLGVLGLGAWVRLAPSDPARWHQPLEFTTDDTLPGGVQRRVDGGDLAALDVIIRATPRTSVLAGSVAEGRVTYITRSLVWNFPDYTTVQQKGDDLLIFARLRFGGSDLGVNRKRVSRWLDQM
ncbi:hypothetical protein TRM7557_03150 [Tritonibacter multivorans]|uniref:DUF1499 domain-containing protein n=1 Tax=Tritonibacter multivorans TaxID=928856 RepID=A0A0P1GH08_9RHOB|nr:DUF1499 domain-containing protein [Tritonibacter multivorans]MDA7420793.1 DUF1499 domain-containing protein [Tritonibacter multivorans]CUH80950.1 hypothetical protein TRM7557_03150 [Tritonibacter multivorans]SFC86519.1 Protein of unknown function [Tritonibacter multivorans]